MSELETPNHIYSQLRSLGCALNVAPPQRPADLEKLIIRGVDFFWNEKSNFDLLLGLLQHRLKGLVNLERLIHLATDLENSQRATLLVICDKMVRHGEKRFNAVINEYENRKTRIKTSPESYTFLKHRYKKYGVDQSFRKYGAKLPDFFGEEERKFFSLEKILRENAWLKTRYLVGPNFRADAIYLKSTNRAISAKDLQIQLGCSKASSYRIWSELEASDFLINDSFFR